MPDHIYHYTSIRSLACILDSRRIRFTRLDRFDDVLEAQTIGRFRFGELLFASSWVASPIEDYPQWSMYGDAMRGVRIRLPAEPFERHEYIPLPGDIAVNTYLPLPMSEAIHEGYKVTPILAEESFLQEVIYVPDVAEVWRQQTTDDGRMLSCRDPRVLARHKDERWAFQEEHRFILMITGRAPNVGSREMDTLPTPGIGYIDVPLSNRAIEQAEITLGPLSAHDDALIVRALLDKYAPGASMINSTLRGSIRGR